MLKEVIVPYNFKMKKIVYKPIGIINTPFRKCKGTPIQPKAGKDIEGKVVILPEYVDGLKDLGGFSHIILIYHFHLSKGFKLHVIPYMDNKERGVFATRAPKRPNPIGISVVKLLKIEKNILYIKNIDIVDETPLLDIKPYIPHFDEPEDIKIGWLEKKIGNLPCKKADDRFNK